MKVYLCKEKGCCPSVEIGENEVRIGEEGNYCTLSKEEFNSLKEKIKKRRNLNKPSWLNELGAIIGDYNDSV